ncbi:inversin-A [Schistocerca cancellata]|uniref:inversin-A n=1 Tax=Schistocerca cancellata TaxID=274614 RepID=UPI00211938BF|nr:inversin-A [Schistocerca cancellata]
MDNGEEGEKGEENEGPTASNEEKGGDGVDEETGEGTDRDAGYEENRDETETEEDGHKREEVEREATEREEAEREEKERQEAERQMQLERERELERALEERSRRRRSQEVSNEDLAETKEQRGDEDGGEEGGEDGGEEGGEEDEKKGGDEGSEEAGEAGDEPESNGDHENGVGEEQPVAEGVVTGEGAGHDVQQGQADVWVRSEEEDEGEQADDEDAAGEDEQQDAEQEKPEDAEQAGDEEVSRLVAAGDVDQLAAMVLSGDGARLAGLRAHHPDVQAFLDNVPAYMEKIAAVHAAARAGSVRELQAALDRRRFAVARDAGCVARPTPLHAAVLLGHTDVVRYLGARFPETLAASDARGRTPLHYAACLADNGHYYHLLTALGARADALDQDGHTPEYYLQHPDELSHRQLLQDIGADDTVADNLVDKERRIASSQGEPVFWTEEGRYLAASLGDPLIKGLKEIADKRPQDPVTYLATYLFNAANNHKSIDNMQENNRLIAPPPPAKGRLEAAPIPSDMDPQEADIEEVPETPENSAIDRDEHGQSMLHFAAARAHGRNGLFQLLQETGLNAGYRDELYRTARDVAIQANIPDNIHDIDKWVLHLAANGEREKLMELLLEGYDHILDVENDDGLSIIEVVAQSEQPETLQFLQSISDFEERREELHNAVRQGNLLRVHELLEADDAELLAIAKNIYGRSSLHIAVLCQDEEITQFLTDRFPATLKTGDNLERTALHYAMGVEKVEELSTFLIRAGARRIAKDLKGRQPSYYFMNKSDILRLQEDEDTFKM